MAARHQAGPVEPAPPLSDALIQTCRHMLRLAFSVRGRDPERGAALFLAVHTFCQEGVEAEVPGFLTSGRAADMSALTPRASWVLGTLFSCSGSALVEYGAMTSNQTPLIEAITAFTLAEKCYPTPTESAHYLLQIAKAGEKLFTLRNRNYPLAAVLGKFSEAGTAASRALREAADMGQQLSPKERVTLSVINVYASASELWHKCSPSYVDGRSIADVSRVVGALHAHFRLCVATTPDPVRSEHGPLKLALNATTGFMKVVIADAAHDSPTISIHSVAPALEILEWYSQCIDIGWQVHAHRVICAWFTGDHVLSMYLDNDGAYRAAFESMRRHFVALRGYDIDWEEEGLRTIELRYARILHDNRSISSAGA